MKQGVLGRAGTLYGGTKAIVWWFESPKEAAADCIKKLMDAGAIDGTEIVSFSEPPLYAFEFAEQHGAKVKMNQELLDMHRELHLMDPDRKKEAIKKLGLIGGGHKSGWQKESEKQRLVRPGQKWWAPTSESRNE